MRVRYLAVVVALASLVVARSGEAQKVKSASLAPMVGPVVGLDLFTFTGSDVTGAKNLTGLALGGALMIQLSPSVFLEPQVLYSTKGASFNVGIDTTDKFTLHYVDVPIMFGVRIPARSGVRPYLMAGPVIGFKAGCDLSETTAGSTNSASCTASGFFDIKSTNFAVTGGAGLDFVAGPMTLQVGGRYEYGLSKPLTVLGTALNVRNTGFALNVTALFSLGSRQ
ncbi:MAG TPA: porin family protein [Gemmatimonadales bacterium]|nr:porin family protein [Gemmatimonadales bacterium]